MKRIIAVALLLLLAAGCTRQPVQQQGELPNKTTDAPDTATLTAEVVDFTESSILVTDSEGGLYSVGLPSRIKVAQGNIVEIEFDGTIMETYPAQLSNVTDVRISEQESNLLGMYLEAIDELMTIDAGLNSGIEMLVFDLTNEVNLNKGQRAALLYLCQNKYQVSAREGTFQDMVDEGLVTELYFEKGMIFTIESEPIDGKKFTFSMNKWRSGDGAYGVNECKASLKDGKWTYQMGAEWIS